MPRRIYLDAGLLLLLLIPGRGLGSWRPQEIPGLHYPRVAQLARVQGSVLVELTIAADGSVARVKVLSGHPMLAAASKVNALLWKFRASEPSTSSAAVRLSYAFVLEGECRIQCCEDRFLFVSPDHIVVTAPLPGIQGSGEQPATH